jgi:hypothetical protein
MTDPGPDRAVAAAAATAQDRAAKLARHEEWAASRRPLWEEVALFFQLLGRESGAMVFSLFPPDPSKPNINISGLADAPPCHEIHHKLIWRPEHSFGVIVNPPRPQPEDWGSRDEHYSIGTSAHGPYRLPKAWGAQAVHIGHAVAFWSEDDGGLSKDAQLALPGLAGLPQPSFSVDTGGKSIHHYWLLAPGEQATAAQFDEFQHRLAYAQKAVCPEGRIDEGLGNCNRVMRCPGGTHPKTGRRSVILRETITERRYTLAELEALIPSLPDLERKVGINRQAPADRGQRGKAAENQWFAKLPLDRQHSTAITMLRAIGPYYREDDPVPLGMEGRPRPKRAHCISVLAGLLHWFGDEEALALCSAAQWESCSWTPAAEADRIPYREHGAVAGIGRVIHLARQYGWRHALEGIEEKMQNLLKRAATKARNSAGAPAAPRRGAASQRTDPIAQKAAARALRRINANKPDTAL